MDLSDDVRKQRIPWYMATWCYLEKRVQESNLPDGQEHSSCVDSAFCHRYLIGEYLHTYIVQINSLIGNHDHVIEYEDEDEDEDDDDDDDDDSTNHGQEVADVFAWAKH